MRRNAVRSIGVEACLFEQKELEQLYAVFKVSACHVEIHFVTLWKAMFDLTSHISFLSLALFVPQAGHLLTRNHGNPEAKDTPPQFPLVQNQCIDCERFKPLFECLTNWGTGEIGATLAQRAFKVSWSYLVTVRL